MDARTRELLQDMREYAQTAMDLFHGVSPAEVEADRKSYLALCYASQVVGEAASRIDPTIRPTLPVSSWRELIGTRNVIVHGYAHIKVAILCESVERDLPILLSELNAIRGPTTP